MQINGKRILVVGNARSGIGAAKLAHSEGARVCIYDAKPYEKWEDKAKDEINVMKSRGIEYTLGMDPNLADYELIIVSPGVPPEIPLLNAAREKGICIVGEFEFAASRCKAPIVAITGTNGKTTTTTLVGEIMKAFNPHTYIVGNIGYAFSEQVKAIDEDGIVVAEVSSFQLETVKKFHAKIGAILNITPDHLNRHGSMENYCECKYQVFKNQVATDVAIVNPKDHYYEETKRHARGKIIEFSTINIPTCGAYLDKENLCENIDGTQHIVCTVNELMIKGTHNIENALASIAITKAFGVPLEIIRKILITFKGVEHRTEYVTTKKDVMFFNDSKATNTDAAIAGLVGLSSLNRPIRLIAGGMDKRISFKEWVEKFEGIVTKVYIIGETKKQIVDECLEVGYSAYETFETLEEAVITAYKESRSGECILLSPACASWDMFPSYEVRGALFKELVNNLEG